MAAKTHAPAMSSFPGIPREEDATANLLSQSDREAEEPKPSFTVTFSPVQVVRLWVFAISITDLVFICMCDWHKGWAAFFAVWVIILCIWTVYNLIACLFRGRNKFDMKLGNLFLSCGRLSSDDFLPSWKKRSYIKNIVDFVFGCLLIIPGVLAFKTHIWQWELQDPVGGLTITLAGLQLIIAVLGIFSLGRKVQVALFKAEESKPAYTISELYRDEMSEPRQSMVSETSEV